MNSTQNHYEPGRAHVEVALAPNSDSNFLSSLDGTVGVFWATYDPPKVGTPVTVKLCLPGGVELFRDAVVAWKRDQSDDAWPGVGLIFDSVDEELADRYRSFIRFREPLHVPARTLQQMAAVRVTHPPRL